MALSEDARYPDGLPFEGTIYRSPERCAAIVYYPAAEDGEDAPLAARGPFPLIALAHTRRLRRMAGTGAPDDTSQDYRQLAGVMAHLARRGFVVIAPDLSWLAPDDGPLRRAAALRDAVSHLRAGSKGLVLADFERVGLVGHGLGGMAALALALDRRCPFYVRGITVLSPAGGAAPARMEGLPPIMILRGTAELDGASAALYAAAGAPKHLVTLPGANHFGFTTSLASEPPFDGAPTMQRRDQQRVAKAYLAAFFERYLGGTADGMAWLCGDATPPELAALGLEVRAELV
jgi:acetyl esterase/lipase